MTDLFVSQFMKPGYEPGDGSMDGAMLVDAEEESHLMIRSHVKFARAVLARWGRPAPATAGEVGELADFLRGCADDYESHGRCRLIRAADLLERQAAPQPVAASERLPGEVDHD